MSSYAKRLAAALAAALAIITGVAAPVTAAPAVALKAGQAVAPDGTVGTVSKSISKPTGQRVIPPSRTDKPGAVKRLGTLQYYYAGGRMTGGSPAMVSQGVAGNITVPPSTTYLESGAYHTLMEHSAERVVGGLRQIAEVGWTHGVGSSVPRLFVGRWINGTFQGYNGADAGWNNYCANGTSPCTLPQAGDSLAGVGGTIKQFAVIYSSVSTPAGWWASYNGNYIGYWNQSGWSGAGVTFTSSDMVQSFGELADDSTTTHCSDMGNGKFGSTFTNPPDATGATDPSYFGSVSLYLGNVATAYTAIANTNAAWFDSGFLSARTYAVGGPGFGGNTGSC